MGKQNFLTKLRIGGKLEITDSNEEVGESYIEKSKSNLSSAKILLENDKLEEAVGLAYYSMYHLLTALLFKIGIKSENHTASIMLLKDIFEIDNSDIAFAKKERIDKQYYVNFHITKEQVKDTITQAELFNSKLLDFISRLTRDKIEFYRNKFISLV